MSGNDEQFMARAIELAGKGRGFVEPNPLVGAVVVRGSKVIGEGYHSSFGGLHAEIVALSAAAGDTGGATLYVSLEPCSTRGKTPPCTDEIIKVGVKRVVIGTLDEDPANAGRAEGILRQAGIEVDVGVLESEAREVNRFFFKAVTTGLPYVTAKWAMSLDGKIATRRGDSKWITCDSSRKTAHVLRAEHQAVLVGIRTILADDPLLTVRNVSGENPIRIIVDSRGRLPAGFKIIRTADEVETILAVGPDADEKNLSALREKGIEVLHVPDSDYVVNLEALMKILVERGIQSVMIEGGGRVLGAAFDVRLIDEVHVFISPMIIGGESAYVAVAGVGSGSVAGALTLRDVKYKRSKGDIGISGKVVYPEETEAGPGGTKVQNVTPPS